MLIKFYNDEDKSCLLNVYPHDYNIPVVGDQVEHHINGRLKFVGVVVSRKMVYNLNMEFTIPHIYLSDVYFVQ